MKKTILCAAVSLFPFGASAATYNFQQVYQTNDGITNDSINEIENFVALDGDVRRVRTSANTEGASSTEFSIDRETGVIKIGASAQSDNGSFRTFSELKIDETFQATGSGDVTFVFDIDGFLSAEMNGFAGFEAGIRLQGYGPNGPSSLAQEDSFKAELLILDTIDTVRTTVNGEVTDVVNSDGALSGSYMAAPKFEFTRSIIDGNFIDLDLELMATVTAGLDSVVASDFLSTAYISFTTTDGLELTPRDAAFLSSATGRPTVSPVPLPASSLLLLGGLATLGAVRRRL